MPSGAQIIWVKNIAISELVVGATYPEMGKVLRKLMPKTFIPGTLDTAHRVEKALIWCISSMRMALVRL